MPPMDLESFLGARFPRSTDKPTATTRRFYLWRGKRWALFAHHIVKSDAPGFHTHPWDGISILFGTYVETRLKSGPKGGSNDASRRRLTHARWLVNFIAADVPHRIDIERPLWTLFLHFNRRNAWAIFDEHGNRLATEPWRGPNVASFDERATTEAIP